ncbi:MAG: histidine phosphatase family protein [Candidatus Berkelbacteria bacterium]
MTIEKYFTKDTDLKFILARHAEAESSDHKLLLKFMNAKADPGITPVGKKQSVLIAKKVFSAGGCDVIVHSSAKRSKMTAKIIAKFLENKCSGDIEEAKSIYLHEVDVGDFSGESGEAVMEMYPKQAKIFYQGNIDDWNFPDGEDHAEIIHRIKSVFAQIKPIVDDGKTVLLIGHSMFNQVILNYLFPKDKEFCKLTDYPHDRVVTINLE